MDGPFSSFNGAAYILVKSLGRAQRQGEETERVIAVDREEYAYVHDHLSDVSLSFVASSVDLTVCDRSLIFVSVLSSA